jgi:histone deacetylase complex regulatory component SIN3
MEKSNITSSNKGTGRENSISKGFVTIVRSCGINGFRDPDPDLSFLDAGIDVEEFKKYLEKVYFSKKREPTNYNNFIKNIVTWTTS